MNFDVTPIETKEYILRAADFIYSENAFLSVSPTGNCQVCCVANFDKLILEVKTIQDLKDLFSVIYTNAAKSLLLVDINNESRMQVLDILRKNSELNCIVLDEPYISSNNSSMNILILNITNLIYQL